MSETIFEAARAGDAAAVQAFLTAGADVAALDAYGFTALRSAAMGANSVSEAAISDAHGNHVIVNAMMEDVQQLISRVTGRPVPEAPEPEPEPEKMSAPQWRAAKLKIDAAIATLTDAGIVVLHDTGTTQSDGFSDCSEVFHERGGEATGLHGFCFYTWQDLNRAKRTSQFNLALWGAPADGAADMLRVAD